MSGGGSGNTTTSQEFKPPENTRAGWDAYMQNAAGLNGQPFQESGIPTVAPWNDFNQGAAQGIYDAAMNGDPSTNAGRAALTGIASGNQANPWQAFLANTAGGGSENPFLSGAQSMAAGKDNPFMIDPQAFIDAQSKDMTSAAQKGTMAQTDAAFNRAGAYGGSAYNEQQAANAKGLSDSIGSMSANARMSANQHNAGMWQQGQQNQLNAMGMGGQMYSQGLGQQLQAAMGGGQMYGQDINAMLSAAGLAPQYANMDLNAFNALNNMGNQYGSYQQGLLNAGNQSFNQQQMYPYLQNEQFGGALTRASGQGGSSVNTATQPGQSGWMNALGAGMGMYGMMKP